jgi:CBS domain-containing protein
MGQAIRKVLDRNLPALPVLGKDGRYAGIFGEREFLQALFPGYVGQLRSTSFLTHSLDAVLERRVGCRQEPVGEHMFSDHVEVSPDVSDLQVAEIFLHHEVLVIPVVDDGAVKGLILRHDFFRTLAERLLAGLS